MKYRYSMQTLRRFRIINTVRNRRRARRVRRYTGWTQAELDRMLGRP